MRQSKQRGAITVFLSVIILVMIVFAGILVDGARLRVADAQVRRAVDSALSSALAGYSNPLKERYGLFALSEGNPDKLRETIEYYLGSNLMTELGDSGAASDAKVYGYLKGLFIKDSFEDAHFMNLYDYRIEEIKVTPIYNLSENQVTKAQLLEYMKYRAPKQLAQNFMEKIERIKESAKIAEAYKKKIDADKLIGKLRRLQAELKIKIDDEVNRFNRSELGYVKGANKGTLASYYINTATDCRILIKYMKALEDKISELEQKIREEKKAEAKAALEAEKKSLEALRSDASYKYASIRDKRDSACDTMSGYVSRAKKSNADALELIDKIKKKNEEIKPKLEELEKYMQDSFDLANTEDAFVSQMQTDIQKLRISMAEGEESAKLGDSLKGNIDALTSSESILSNIEAGREAMDWGIEPSALRNEKVTTYLDFNYDNSAIFTAAASDSFKGSYDGELEALTSQFDGIAQGYNNSIIYDFTKPTGQKSSDPRKAAEAAGKAAADEKGIPEGKKLSAADQQKLPSYWDGAKYPNKAVSKDFSSDDKSYQESYDTSLLQNINGNISLTDEYNESDSFAQRAFDFTARLGNAIKDKEEKLRDDIYVNEFIIGTFKNSVPIVSESGVKQPDMDLRQRDKKSQKTFFDNCETEYILHGQSSEKANLLMVKGQILLIRFAMDTLDIYMDRAKNEEALGIATAIAGWTGFGVPIVHTLVICSWGMEKAAKELGEIMKGKSVPFSSKAKDIRLTYHDYLRLLLLLEDNDVKLNRIEDLIQLNMQQTKPGFRISDYNTYLRVEVKVSMKHMFLTLPFMPDGMKKDDRDRHDINIVLYKGY